jgi:hypothetical protein
MIREKNISLFVLQWTVSGPRLRLALPGTQEIKVLSPEDRSRTNFRNVLVLIKHLEDDGQSLTTIITHYHTIIRKP